MRNVTICILLKEDKILLGVKKRGFGSGKYTCFGGKLKEGENLEQGAIRELFEEVGIIVRKEFLEKKAELTFKFPYNESWSQIAHVYLIRNWDGEPIESEEMKPEWFYVRDMPYSKMWESDSYWMSHVLQGKYVVASFTYGQNNEVLENKVKIDSTKN